MQTYNLYFAQSKTRTRKEQRGWWIKRSKAAEMSRASPLFACPCVQGGQCWLLSELDLKTCWINLIIQWWNLKWTEPISENPKESINSDSSCLFTRKRTQTAIKLGGIGIGFLPSAPKVASEPVAWSYLQRVSTVQTGYTVMGCMVKSATWSVQSPDAQSMS